MRSNYCLLCSEWLLPAAHAVQVSAHVLNLTKFCLVKLTGHLTKQALWRLSLSLGCRLFCQHSVKRAEEHREWNFFGQEMVKLLLEGWLEQQEGSLLGDQQATLDLVCRLLHTAVEQECLFLAVVSQVIGWKFLAGILLGLEAYPAAFWATVDQQWCTRRCSLNLSVVKEDS